MKPASTSPEAGSPSVISNEARWIGLRHATADRSQPAAVLRQGFEVAGKVKTATLRFAALGVAEFEINGIKVGRGVLSPGWSDYRSRVQMVTHDVSGLLRPGANRIGAMVGDGWYCGYLAFKGKRNTYGEFPRVLAELVIELVSGERIAIPTTGDWQARTGPIRESDLYNGEVYDARRELPGWSRPGGSSSGWKKAHVFPDYGGILEPKRNEEIEAIEELAVQSITERPGGKYVIDFGQNLVGVCRLRLRGERGRRITLRFAEMLNADGSVYTENLRSARATDTYICRGGGVEEWTPRFTFHGFRYVEVSGLKSRPRKDSLVAQVWHSAMKPTGSFECSDKRVNRLNQNIRWGMRGNFLDVPTDCPQRDERLGWTGDAQVFVRTAAFHYDVDAFFRKWMKDLVDSQREDGAFPDVAPYVVAGFGNAGWADAGVICPWVIYERYGDEAILRENYGAMSRWIDFQERTANGKVRPVTTYGDWLAIDAVKAHRAPVPRELVGTAYFAHTASLMGRIAGILGRKEDQARFERLFREVAEAFCHTFVTPAGRIVGDCQTAYLLALGFDLLPEAMVKPAVERLVELIKERDWHLSTGFLGTPFLCPVLTRYGRTDVAYRLLMQDTYPSWLYTVANGATTMWERWNSYTREHGFGPVEMNSFNHYAYGAVGEWMYAVVGGIRPAAPGFARILIAPEPGGGLEWAKTSLETPVGAVRCEWRLKGRRLSLDVSVPEGAPAKLKVPKGYSLPNGRSEMKLAPGRTRLTADAKG